MSGGGGGFFGTKLVTPFGFPLYREARQEYEAILVGVLPPFKLTGDRPLLVEAFRPIRRFVRACPFSPL